MQINLYLGVRTANSGLRHVEDLKLKFGLIFLCQVG